MKKAAVDFTLIQKKYPGKWVALSNDEKHVFASAKTAKQVLHACQKKGVNAPILYRVPSKITLSISISLTS